MPNSLNIAENIHQIQQKIADYATKYGRRPEDIQLLAVSKTKPISDIQQAYDAGIKDFGESYLQEALEKISALKQTDINWHFIGGIQSNKTRDIANNFSWVHSVDRLKIAQRLSDQRDPSLPTLNICLQINISSESSKSGISPSEINELATKIKLLPNIRFRGLMAIPAKAESFEQQRAIFRDMHQLLNSLNKQGFQLDTLSMGMTNDLEAAIAEGSNIVRIGTAIFGARNT